MGGLLIIGAVAGEAVYMTFMKRMSPDVAALDVAAAVIALGALWFLPLAGYEMLWFTWQQTDWGDWWLIGYNGIVVTVVANLLISDSMQRISAASAAPWTALMPASAVALSVLVLHETLAWYLVVGMILIVSGIRIASRRGVMEIAGLVGAIGITVYRASCIE